MVTELLIFFVHKLMPAVMPVILRVLSVATQTLKKVFKSIERSEHSYIGLGDFFSGKVLKI